MTESTTPFHLLSNSRYSVLMTPRGGGYSALGGLAIMRWTPDPSSDTTGSFCYVRDVESGSYWSITEAPFAPAGAKGTVQASADRIETNALHDHISARQQLFVAGGANAEVRRIRIANRDTRRRILDVSTYAELALNTPAGDAGHPAFSKLFVQTAHDASRDALIAWRRARSPDDQPLWVAQRMRGAQRAVEYDTDRTAVIGRTRSTANPAYVQRAAPLGGATGTVLDPVFAMRTRLELEPGEHADLEIVMYAADSRASLEAMLDSSATLQPAAMDPIEDGIAALGLPLAWLDGMELTNASSEWSGDDAHADARAATDDADGDGDTVGRFSDDGSQYIINVGGRRAPTPQPWINVLANEAFGTLISEAGAGYTWSGNSRVNRVTPWSNDPVSDPPGEAVYVRDDATGAFWSPLPSPCGDAREYEVRHGFGFSTFRSASHDLVQEATVFVPRADSVRVTHITLTNESSADRVLSLFSCAALVLGSEAAATRTSVVTHADTNGVIYATNRNRGEFSGNVVFAASCGAQCVSISGSRASFTGSNGNLRRPAALFDDALDGRVGAGLDPCAALHVRITVPARATVSVAFLLGEAATQAEADACIDKYSTIEAVAAARAHIAQFWRDLLSIVQVETPVRSIDLMLNGWLAYQNLACRMWARSAFYQSGGAFGFRDQLQDSSALLYYDPGITRDQIVLHASHQFVEGDVMHWWHPPLSKGIRTRFSDDLLWLPYVALFYMARSGDTPLLDVHARFLTGALLEDGEDEMFMLPADSGTTGSVYEHCCRSIDRSLTHGAHGLPLMGTGDWNDGMNRVGRLGRGESVWLGFFLFDILHDFIPYCDARGDAARASKYRAYVSALHAALNDDGWDGEWYRRAYYDDGSPIGSRESDECRIDTLAQAWAIISRAAPQDRATSSIDAMREHLVMRKQGIIRLLTPAFDRTPHDPGYIKGYVPGVRENGGQYTHAAMWAIRAVAELGDRRGAASLLEMLTPVHHTSSAEKTATYQGEPYVIAADVYSTEPHVGRAGWTWYTGSAGWMSRVALESVLGFSIEGGTSIRLCPCIPDDWPGFTLRYRFPDGTQYVFNITNGGVGNETTTSHGSITDGEVTIPIARDGATHEVSIALGRDVMPRYNPRPAAP